MKVTPKLVDSNKFGPWAIVTGASSCIGKEFARHLAASGLNVVLVAQRLDALEALGRALVSDFAVQYRAVKVDLAEPDGLDRIEVATCDLDVGLVVGNAGMATPGEFLEIDVAEFLHGVRLKVVANLMLAHHFGRKLATRGRGGMLLVSSIGGLQGVPYVANNAATEAYVLSLGEALHVEFRRLGLHLTVLMSGPTATPSRAEMGIDPADMPMTLMSAERCAVEGLVALNANRATHIVGRMNRILATLIPRTVAIKIMSSMIGDKSASSPTAKAPSLAPPQS